MFTPNIEMFTPNIEMFTPNIEMFTPNIIDLGSDVIYEVSLYLSVEDFVSFQRVCKNTYNTISKMICIQRSEAHTRNMVHKAIIKRESFLLHGPGGVGKSYTISKIYEEGKQKGLNVVATAPTGMGAIHLPSGRTIHSLMGLMWKHPVDIIQRWILENGERLTFYKRLKNIDILIIDEISMVGATLFEKLDILCRYAKKK
jgi:hypothetical protein